jgi:hypothetical protein
MADEHWYVLKVRSGFESVVAQRLGKLHLEVVIPDQKCTLYCRFALKDRRAITSVPGVLDIMGIPEPVSIDPGLDSLQ